MLNQISRLTLSLKTVILMCKVYILVSSVTLAGSTDIAVINLERGFQSLNKRRGKRSRINFASRLRDSNLRREV